MDDLDFTEEEIREQLENLGYKNVSHERLKEFKKDLERLVQHERSKNSSSSTVTNETSGLSSEMQVPHRHPLNEAGNTYALPVSQPKYDYGSIGKENSTRQISKEATYSNRNTVHVPTATYQVRGNPLTHQGEETDDYAQGLTDTTLDTTASSDRRGIKRKTARKRDGHAVYEESIVDSELDDVSSMQDALERLRIPDYCHQGPSHTLSRMCRRPDSAQSEPVYRLPDDYEGPTALIRPMTANPHTRNIRKCDPVSRYQQYRQSWAAQKAPGEKPHKSLRWHVREHMLYHDEVVEKKQHKVGAQNKFVIPSDKKRKNLRWQIRQDLAQGVVPPSIFD